MSFERFEAWSEEVQEWQDDYDLSDYATVTALRHLMDALFDDIFPSRKAMAQAFDADSEPHNGYNPT